MKKQTKIIIAVITIIAIVAIILAIVIVNNQPKTNLKPIETEQDLSQLIEEVYEGQENLLSSLNTTIVEVSDANVVQAVTGLTNGDSLEFLAVSEPMMSSQAYSFVLAKVKDGVDANQVAKMMSEQINPAKWICVSAEKIYATSSGDVVCLIMASEEWAKPIYEKFKQLAGSIGQEYEKTEDFSSGEPIE